MTQEDAEDMHRLALGGSSAVSGDASESRHERGARQAREADEESRATALASQASPAKRGAEPSDEQISLRPYIYGREAGANEKVWTEAAVLETARQAVREALAQSAPSEKLRDALEDIAGLSNEQFLSDAKRIAEKALAWSDSESESASMQAEASQATKDAEPLLAGVHELLLEAHAHWDADRDSKVGKILLALTGASKGYDKRADAFQSALDAARKSQGEQERTPEQLARDLQTNQEIDAMVEKMRRPSDEQILRAAHRATESFVGADDYILRIARAVLALHAEPVEKMKGQP